MIKLSIYITTQNRPLLLERALRSLALQTDKEFEVIICDDCSNPENQKNNLFIIEKFQPCFHKLRYLFNEKIEGACYSRNRAIAVAEGQYITGLDDDDLFHPERVEYFFAFLKQNQSASFICTKAAKLTQDFHPKPINKDRISFDWITLENLKNYNAVGNQIFVEKEKLIKISGFDINMCSWQDYDTWFRLLSEFGPAAKLPSSTMFLDDSDSRKRITTSSKSYQGYQMFLMKHGSLLNDKQKLSLFYMDKINRKQPINFFSPSIITRPKLFFRVFKYYLTYRLPYLFGIYQRFFH